MPARTRPLKILFTLGLGISLSCGAAVSSTIVHPDQREDVEPTAGQSTLVPAPEAGPFEVADALSAYEKILGSLDGRMANTGPEDMYELEKLGTWLKDRGLRSLYYFARDELSIPVAGAVVGVPVFISGPHADRPDFGARDDFGHYNPEFVSRVRTAAETIAEHPALVSRTKNSFVARLQAQALTYVMVYRAEHQDPQWFAAYLREYEDLLYRGGYSYRYAYSLFSMVEAFSRDGHDWSEAQTAAQFWVRREVDGTAGDWVATLEALLHAYGIKIPDQVPGLPDGARA